MKEKNMKHAVILDLETTGLDPKKDKIIEIGLLEFLIDDNFSPHILSLHSELEDPEQDLSEDIESLTGLNKKILAGRKIDWNLVASYLSRSSFVLAHNMNFDRSFLQNQTDLDIQSYHWVCSQNHIDWFKKGHKTRSLNYLACDQGFINPFPHRALFDCATTMRIISPYLKEMIERSYEKQFEFLATSAPFEQKDHLKANGYSWDPKRRVWYKLVFQSELSDERNFLLDNIYRGNSLHQEKELLSSFAS